MVVGHDGRVVLDTVPQMRFSPTTSSFLPLFSLPLSPPHVWGCRLLSSSSSSPTEAACTGRSISASFTRFLLPVHHHSPLRCFSLSRPLLLRFISSAGVGMAKICGRCFPVPWRAGRLASASSSVDVCSLCLSPRAGGCDLSSVEAVAWCTLASSLRSRAAFL